LVTPGVADQVLIFSACRLVAQATVERHTTSWQQHMPGLLLLLLLVRQLSMPLRCWQLGAH
jgi:hypothetical protein